MRDGLSRFLVGPTLVGEDRRTKTKSMELFRNAWECVIIN